VAQVVANHLARRGHRPVVGVVEQQPEVPAGRALAADRAHERGVVPLVHEHEVGAVERAVEVERRDRLVLAGDGVHPRERAADVGQRLAPAVGDQVLAAPAVARLVADHLVAAIEQLGHDPAQEVRVAVVPVRQQRVAEDHDLHAATSVRSVA
jgi:hypothetical protein